jgi:DNA-binding transcriptional regulator/RsmH inhibitor MraZ
MGGDIIGKLEEKKRISVISGFRYEVYKNCTLLACYSASSGNLLSTFRDNLSAPSLRIKIGPIGCPETSIINYHYSLRNYPEERSF